MELASVAYAQSNRSQRMAPLRELVFRATNPNLHLEPDYADNFAVSDYILAKMGNAPHEAAQLIIQRINNDKGNQYMSLLALSLLDVCVKNCGYAFHLQISTRQWLNELVKRFPKRPSIHPTRVQSKTLEALEEWRQTICRTASYKDELGYIRDMCTLLSYNGYVFPQIRSEDAAVLNQTETLKSAEELARDEEASQKIKLQELLRRGGPENLQEANRLMKILAGYENQNKTDYRAKAAEEVSRVQEKAKLLEERLQALKPGDQLTEGDAFEDLANALQSAQPKIQRMCEEESDDHEAVSKLLEINDSIHRTIERWKLVKKGDIDGASKIPQGTLGTSTGVGKNADNELSLIDFDEPATNTNGTSASTVPAQSNSSLLENDLLGLSLQDSASQQSNGIFLGGPTPQPTNQPFQQPSQAPQIIPPQTSTSSAQPAPQSGHTPMKPNYDPFSTITSSHPSSRSQTPAAASAIPQHRNQTSDPFAALTSPPPRHSSPFSTSHQAPPTSSTPSKSLLDLGLQNPSTSQAQQSASSQAILQHNDDDWEFTSAVPEDSQSTTQHLTVSNSEIKILFHIERPPESNDSISIKASFSNNTPLQVQDYTFQLAVTKQFRLQLVPQSGRTLQPNQENGITQDIVVHGVSRGQTNLVKMRWKASWKVMGNVKQEQGEVPALSIV